MHKPNYKPIVITSFERLGSKTRVVGTRGEGCTFFFYCYYSILPTWSGHILQLDRNVFETLHFRIRVSQLFVVHPLDSVALIASFRGTRLNFSRTKQCISRNSSGC